MIVEQGGQDRNSDTERIWHSSQESFGYVLTLPNQFMRDTNMILYTLEMGIGLMR